MYIKIKKKSDTIKKNLNNMRPLDIRYVDEKCIFNNT